MLNLSNFYIFKIAFIGGTGLVIGGAFGVLLILAIAVLFSTAVSALKNK